LTPSKKKEDLLQIEPEKPLVNSIAFIDIEISPKERKILDIGSIKGNGSSFHNPSVSRFIRFLDGTQFICGHNIIHHDLKYIGRALSDAGINVANAIDTLFLSPLFFPTKPYHSLVKDDKLLSDDLNNPLNDSINARDLFYDEVAAFNQMAETLQQIFFLLLKDQKEFRSFFRYIGFSIKHQDLQNLIRRRFANEICDQLDLSAMILKHPVELAYCLSLINSFIKNKKIHSITPPWVLKNYPEVENIMFRLRNQPCVSGCVYCDKALDVREGLKRFFGFESYRSFGGKPLQEQAVKAAVDNQSILAIFPTGGGKSIAFQVPALMSGEAARGLTVVISPLQSLMKDQVDNLEKKGITEAVTINGLLDPIERAKSFERVEDGSASILYISPESLRSRTIERLILGRKIVRFVIDEAHCFSSWGHDFRVDYQYIGDFIRQLQEKKNLEYGIPVSCFTATAKQKVIQDIRQYFIEKLNFELQLFTSNASRTNLNYSVINKNDEEEKYQSARLLIESKNCPTIVYVSRTIKAYKLAERLTKDGFDAKPYHGKMDKEEKSKNQDSFINGETQIMVATAAFGMGVDKKDVGMVIHYDISDSLENYVQEAGRAGRDENIEADCFILFNEEDLNKHFILLNQTKLTIGEINQVWRAIKNISNFRSTVSNSALEIARKAGWDESVVEIETRVTTAIAALENAGYLKRGQNIPRIFANSILSKNAQEAIDKINVSEKFLEKQKQQGIRIIKKLFSSKNRKRPTEEVAESRVDYISDHLGILREEVIRIIYLLREEKILADTKDLTAYIRKKANKNRSLNIVESFTQLENFLLPIIDEQERTYHIKELNENAKLHGCDAVSPHKIRTVLNFWAIKNWIKRQSLYNSRNHFAAVLKNPQTLLKEKIEKRHHLAKFIIEYLFDRKNPHTDEKDQDREEVLVEFSVYELKDAYKKHQSLFKFDIDLDDIEETLFYLSRIEAIKIEGGFLVVYNRLTIKRLEHNNRKQYTLEDYQKLNEFYSQKVQQIHIVGEYARKMINDYKDALQFVEDYFQLNYQSFLNKYFKGNRRDEIKRTLTNAKFRQLFGELSPTQLKIINDNESKYIVVAAGPGSGKTRVLVHKLASLLLMEDIKHEQLLMVTFSRAAATEFKKRLQKMIGNAAYFIEIKTFHSYCFDLLGKIGSLEKSDTIIKKAIEKIDSGEVEPGRITKTVLVIDEAQDMDENEFRLIKTLMKVNEEMRVIAVGDDDQNIYEFRGSNSKYLEQIIKSNKATKYELVENFRSKSNLVDFTNQFVKRIERRLKNTPIIPRQSDNGKIKLIRYQRSNLITPLVRDILTTDLTGTTCVLTKTNYEALQITGLLLKKGMRAKLIQTNDDFNLHNLLEVRYFLNQLNSDQEVSILTDEAWRNAKRQLKNEFGRSTKLDVCMNIIEDYEAVNPKRKYKSDLEVFIRESKLEDFFNEQDETIFVSTIHKSKGKEFDHVFLMLNNFDVSTDPARRQLYVAMTRAKKNLTVHLNSNILDNLSVQNLQRINDDKKHPPPQGMAIHLTHRDVWLSYFANRQHLISGMRSGDKLTWNGKECINTKGQPILRFSKNFSKEIEKLNEKNYRLKKVTVNFILYWLNEETEKEIKIILPELYFKKMLKESQL